ncbi:GlxA family transcriptional regulator [Aliamphritea spongicola]|uniref:GlxA family transcriptional regulator n=1 Tax=Aliamphritea spongicola TaxID=707589 RepID=UPI00196AD01F|nr:helix-turn-helix domain-containing protein [Aliamphritea spongicola]MBN3563663.1 helix-turn-helix domain-containing protein [Aliamphritea spongicola]
MLRPEPDGRYRLTFLLLPGYSMASLQAAIDPLRLANRVLGRECYQWHLLGNSAAPVSASNGLILPSADYQYEVPANLFVIAGQQLWQENYPLLCWWLQTLYRQQTVFAGIGGGSHLLAQARLLNRGTVCMQGPAAQQFSRLYPHIQISDKPYILTDGNTDCISCAGGIAPGQLMLNFVDQQFNSTVAAAVAEAMMLPGHWELNRGDGVSDTGDLRLQRAVNMMNKHLEHPLSSSELADRVHVSVRHLERLFKSHFEMTPSAYYMKMRLQAARRLLYQSGGDIAVIASRCGFKSGAHFSRTYSRHYGIGPSRDRQRKWRQTERPAGSAY